MSNAPAAAPADRLGQIMSEMATNSSIRVIVRVDGKDRMITGIKLAYDGVLGNHVVLETAPLVC